MYAPMLDQGAESWCFEWRAGRRAHDRGRLGIDIQTRILDIKRLSNQGLVDNADRVVVGGGVDAK